MSDLRNLNEIDQDSEDVFMSTLMDDHYPNSLNDTCLYTTKIIKIFRRWQKPRET